jgi:CheY-like chemotaxis protein
MGSKLNLNSEFGDGSEFYFDIKVKTSNQSGTAEKIKAQTTNINSKSNVITTDEKIIFIVEDNSINMLLAKTLVKKIIPNAQIIELVNGKQAVDKIKETLPDLILMDVQMPIMNGYEATSEIRKMTLNKQLPIIALTAGTVVGEKEKCIEAGMNDYISKPIDKENLMTIIQHWITLKP